MGRRWLTGMALVWALGAGLTARDARAVVVERVVAVVGEKPILLTDLYRRARPYVRQILASTQNPIEQSAEQQKLYAKVLDQMISDRLVEQAADKARLPVTEDEVDDGLKQSAIDNGVTLKDVFAEARRQGFSESEYREEVRRQITEGKLVQLRIAQRVRVTDDDARVAFQRYLRELGTERLVDVRILARRIPPAPTPAQIAAEDKLAAEVVKRARDGEDFCSLVRQYSQDANAKRTCGSPGAVPLSKLVPPIDEMARNLKAREVSEPLRLGDVVLVVQMARAPFVPSFEEARPAMLNRARADILEREKKLWYQELRKGVYIDVRF